MAKINPFNGIRLLFKSLSGGFDVELDDDEGYDKKELAELEEMTAKTVSSIEETHGEQTMVVDDDKEEEKDRLGIKKPKKSDKPQQQQKTETIKIDQNEQGNEGRE